MGKIRSEVISSPKLEHSKPKSDGVVFFASGKSGGEVAYQRIFDTSGNNIAVEPVDVERWSKHTRIPWSEPSGEDPRDVALAKGTEAIRVIGQVNETAFEPQTTILSNDIVFRCNGEVRHRPDRVREDGKKMSRDELVVELGQLYSRPFTASWDVSFVAMDLAKSRTRLADFTVMAQYPALTTEQIEQNLLSSSNAGLPLVEIGRALGLSFSIIDDDGVMQELPADWAESIIARKVLPDELALALCFCSQSYIEIAAELGCESVSVPAHFALFRSSVV